MLSQKQYNKLILLEIYIEQKVQKTFFMIEKAKETVLNFSKGAVKVLWFYFV